MENQILKDYINGLEIIDTHEHLPWYEKDRNPQWDVIDEFFSHYSSVDIINAGLNKTQFEEDVFESNIDIVEKWKIIEPFWQKSKFTGYGRSLCIIAKDIYGVNDLTTETIEELNNKFISARNIGNHYEFILKQKSKIQVSLLDTNKECDPKYFKKVFRIQEYLDLAAINNFINNKGGSKYIKSFDDFTDSCCNTINERVKNGWIAVKIPNAYNRSLLFDKSDYKTAKNIFENYILGNKADLGVEKEAYKLENYMFHFILKEISKHNLPVQIHTGILEGNGNILSNSHPSLLNNVFLEFPEITFVIMHISYPYYMEIGALSKMFPNVYIDMCWSHIISPTAARNALSEWIDLLPINKVAAFGGDYLFVDGVYSHQKIARENVFRALSSKINESIFGIDEAKEIARAFFIDNPVNMFNL